MLNCRVLTSDKEASCFLNISCMSSSMIVALLMRVGVLSNLGSLTSNTLETTDSDFSYEYLLPLLILSKNDELDLAMDSCSRSFTI